LRNIVREFEPGVVEGWMYHGNLGAALAARSGRRTAALIWNVRHCLDAWSSEKRLTRWTIRANRRLSEQVRAIVYNSRLARRQHEEFGFAARPGTVIPNGFDLRRFQPSEAYWRKVRRELGIAPEATTVGHVGRYHPLKDHALFLRAAARLAYVDSSVHFVMIGRGVGRDNPELAPLLAELPPERLTLAGERPDLEYMLPAIDVVCQSSRSESFPNVLGEAMACGVPCIATRVGDSAALIGDTGALVAPRDEASLFDALRAFVGMEPEERAKLGAAARARMEQYYSAGAMAGCYQTLYERCVAGGRPACAE
jgi:glycosyltransferase involved in cell wall biosynthesis